MREHAPAREREEQNQQSASPAGGYSGPTRQCGGRSVAESGLVGGKKEADVAAFATSAPAHRAGLTRALCSLKNAPLLSTVA